MWKLSLSRIPTICYRSHLLPAAPKPSDAFWHVSIPHLFLSPTFTWLYTFRDLHTSYILNRTLSNLLNVTLIQPVLSSSTHHQLKYNSLFAATPLLRSQIPKKGHQLSSCSHAAVSVLRCSPGIDCSRDILTFALNQACSGKGLLIRHPFKTAPTSYLCYVRLLSRSSFHFKNASVE